MKPVIAVLAVALALPATAGWCAAAKAKQEDRAAAKRPPPPAPALDITRWPVYPGAALQQQISMTGDQLRAMGEEVPAEAKPYLGKLQGVQVLGYRLPETAAGKDVLAFYEPRALAAGYRVMVKDLSDDPEMSAVYTGPDSGILVLSIDREGQGRTLEIVSVHGDIKAMAALKGLKEKGPGARKPAPPEPPPK
ncbi:MAG TPA: hypothetical protein VFU47_06070 [Armatimonadota bacterium]|nr:hypothetical protein [Armatimonadota bacterium]